MSNTITAFFNGRVGVCESLYQYDYGIVMVLDGVMFGTVFDAYFSTTGEEDAIPVIGKYNRIAIPDSCLQRPGTVTLHIPIHEGQNDSEVEYIVTFRVIGRARPEYDGTSEESTAIAKALAVLQDIQGDVSTWLDEHPEATTTVLDGSLTEAKFTNALKLKTIKDYVTPEMYGAEGDGVTDDTEAFQQALNSGKIVKLANKTYSVNKLVISTKGSSIIGSGSAKTHIKSSGGIELLSATNTKLKGFTLWSGLDLPTPRTENDGTGIYLHKADESTSITREQFDDLIVSGYYVGINSDGLWTAEFRNIRVDYCWCAFELTNGFGANFTNCYFTSSNKILIYITNKGFSLAFNSCNFGIKNTDAFIFANGENSVALFNSCNLECDDVVSYQSGSKYIFYTDKGTYVFNACTLWSNIGTSDVYFFRGNNFSRFVLNQCLQRLYYGGQYSSNWFDPSDSELVNIDNVGASPIFDIRDSAPSQFMAGTVYLDANDGSLKIRRDGAWKRIGTGTVFSSSAPSDDVGQLWVNDHDVYLQTANKGWLPLNCFVQDTEPSLFGVGTLWFDTSNNKLKIRANSQWNAIN